LRVLPIVNTTQFLARRPGTDLARRKPAFKSPHLQAPVMTSVSAGHRPHPGPARGAAQRNGERLTVLVLRHGRPRRPARCSAPSSHTSGRRTARSAPSATTRQADLEDFLDDILRPRRSATTVPTRYKVMRVVEELARVATTAQSLRTGARAGTAAATPQPPSGSSDTTATRSPTGIGPARRYLHRPACR
jgi:hypothetical protein